MTSSLPLFLSPDFFVLLYFSQGSIKNYLSTSQGRGNVCVHSTLLRPYLWNYSRSRNRLLWQHKLHFYVPLNSHFEFSCYFTCKAGQKSSAASDIYLDFPWVGLWCSNVFLYKIIWYSCTNFFYRSQEYTNYKLSKHLYPGYSTVHSLLILKIF